MDTALHTAKNRLSNESPSSNFAIQLESSHSRNSKNHDLMLLKKSFMLLLLPQEPTVACFSPLKLRHAHDSRHGHFREQLLLEEAFFRCCSCSVHKVDHKAAQPDRYHMELHFAFLRIERLYAYYHNRILPAADIHQRLPVAGMHQRVAAFD